MFRPGIVFTVVVITFVTICVVLSAAMLIDLFTTYIQSEVLPQ